MVLALVIVAVVTDRAPAVAGQPLHVARLTAGAVFDGDFPDPSILLVGDRYFAYSTQSGPFHFQVMSSTDLTTWSAPAEALPQLPTWAEPGATWAPAASAVSGGGYELFYAARDRALSTECIGRATSSSPAGPFVDDASEPLLCQPSLGGSIDPYVFSDQGVTYLVWKSDGANGALQQVWSQVLSPGDAGLVGVPSLLLSATAPWEHGVVEGPAMLATPNGLYLYFSGNRWSTSAYAIGVVGCDTPLGPCANGLSPQALSTSAGVRGPGGPTFFTDRAGEMLMAFAAWSGTPGSASGRRELYLYGVDTTGTFPTLIELLWPAGHRTAAASATGSAPASASASG
jgi:beta-xylosidase